MSNIANLLLLNLTKHNTIASKEQRGKRTLIVNEYGWKTLPKVAKTR
jgi:hypothetical protein